MFRYRNLYYQIKIIYNIIELYTHYSYTIGKPTLWLYIYIYKYDPICKK